MDMEENKIEYKWKKYEFLLYFERFRKFNHYEFFFFFKLALTTLSKTSGLK